MTSSRSTRVSEPAWSAVADGEWGLRRRVGGAADVGLRVRGLLALRPSRGRAARPGRCCTATASSSCASPTCAGEACGRSATCPAERRRRASRARRLARRGAQAARARRAVAVRGSPRCGRRTPAPAVARLAWRPAAAATGPGRTARSRWSARARRPRRTPRPPRGSAGRRRTRGRSASRTESLSGLEVAGPRERDGRGVEVAASRAARCRCGTARSAPRSITPPV